MSIVEQAQFAPREKQILQLLGRGMGKAEIAKELNIQARTVHRHLYMVVARLSAVTEQKVWSRVQLAEFARKELS